ncbi:hypothetical protein N182_29905 [Sinorhizobium sp. GL2]|nr:hypothetical protein N182_29905 [Sinorhizobium sp. GL2]
MQYIGLAALTFFILFTCQVIFGGILTSANLEALAMNMVFEGIMALGMTFVIISGGIDLSVASVFAFGEILCAKMMTQAGLPIPLAILATLCACTAIGAINGVLTVAFRVHPMIITMGTLLTLRGINIAITDGSSVSGFSDQFLMIGTAKILGMNIPVIFFLFMAVILGILLAHHRFFRQLYVIGGGERAARLSGINVSRIKIMAYALSAMLAGAAGIMAASRYGAAHWGHGNLAELKAIAAVAIGGANINGGTGTVFGTVLGVVFLAVVHNAFVTSAINPFWYDVVSGVTLLLAVVISQFLQRRARKNVLAMRQAKLNQVATSLVGGKL